MVKIALCQTDVFPDKAANIENAYRKVSRAAYNGAKIICLGEMFNCPYSGSLFKQYAEQDEDGDTIKMLKRVSNEWQIYTIGGSIPEIHNGKIYNTSYIINPKGDIIDKYRKIHLFDIDIRGGISFKESEFLSAGNEIKVFDTIYGKIGVCICYDIRFPELFTKMINMGAKMIFVPAAFNITTGSAHWHTLFKARAIDNQVYIMGVSPARALNSTYSIYGHSMAVDPWGRIMAEAMEHEDIIYADIDIEYENSIREQMPLLKHRRKNIY